MYSASSLCGQDQLPDNLQGAIAREIVALNGEFQTNSAVRVRFGPKADIAVGDPVSTYARA
jgi:hypothetical protein